MFVALMLLIDLFTNLGTYLTTGAAFSQIMLTSLYYIPKAIDYALPISILFAVAYTLGSLYARNELTCIIASGVPFWRLTASLLMFGALASVGSFYFSDKVVVPTLKEKNELEKKLKHQRVTPDMSNIVITSEGGKRVYSVDYYDTKNEILNGVRVIGRDADGKPLYQLIAPKAVWGGENWVFSNPRLYVHKQDDVEMLPFKEDKDYTEQPDTFRRHAVDPKDLDAHDAGLLVRDLKNSGLPYIDAEAEYYHRFSFSVTCFIVVILSISMGGRFRKNILLMSLLTSIIVAVVYYVMEMVTMMLGRMGYIPPIAGAWSPVIFFILVGIVMVRYSKT
jgi:lipopolysaccharide export system permease protein